MRLEALEPDYGEFYVPSFCVKVGADDLVRDLFLAVTRVEVALKEKAAGHFSFTVANAFDWERREFTARRGQEEVDLLELFAFGASVEVALGYGDASRLKPILKAIVTEISTNFAAQGAPQLTISGFDALYALTIGKSTRHWEEAPDSDAVSEIVRENNLSADIVSTTPAKPRIDQNEESDFAFLTKLAERNATTFYMRGETLYFGPRRNTESESVELEWGKGLASFSPTANLAKQVTEVEVSGWSAEKGEAIIGRASQGDESDREGDRESGAERVAKALGRSPVLKLRAAVHTQAEADARAKAILEERAQDFVTGDGECVGLPEIVPDSNIALAGLGRAFNKTYYVTEATHSLDASGYRTRFQVRETTV
jgi:phage protein D